MNLIGKHRGALWHPQGWDVNRELFSREPLAWVTNVRLTTATHNLLYQIYSNELAAGHPVVGVFSLRNQHVHRIVKSARSVCK